MSGMMRPGMGAASWRRQDESVVGKKLAKGTLRRIVRFAKPYRWYITLFLVLVIISAFLVIASPLLFKKIVDDGISKGNAPLVTALALLVVAVLAVVEAALGLMQRWFSARIGEGLIFDLRTEVFAHVQRMPVAFFTRTQTGALVSRLNNDVIGAQQAFTSTLSGVVSNMISLILVVGAMLVLSWQITVVALADAADVPDPGPVASDAGWPATDPRADAAQRRDGDDDDRAVQRRRARCSSSCSAARTSEDARVRANAPAGSATSASGSRWSAGCSSPR